MKITYLLRAERRESVCLARSRSATFVQRISALAVIVMLLSACASAAQPTPIPTISLDGGNTENNLQSSNEDSVTASAVIVPVRDVELAFTAVGRVTAVEVKVGDRVTAGEALVALDATIQEARVREAEANLLAAQVQLKYNKRLGLDEVHIESSEADVARVQALLDSTNAVLASQFTLVAPFAGTIVSLDIAPGESVVPGQVVIVLADLSKYQVRTTDLSERDVTQVHIGQSANIFIQALQEEFTGRIVEVDRISSTLGGDVVFEVTIALDEQPEGLLWGMSADVEIETVQ